MTIGEGGGGEGGEGEKKEKRRAVSGQRIQIEYITDNF